jgi:transcriptional regulator with XRE-family HTH domain
MSSVITMGSDPHPSERNLTAEVSNAIIGDVAKHGNLGERLRFARQLRKIKTNELNRLVVLPGGQKLGSGYISNVENGKRKEVEAKYVHAIASTLSVRPEWLMSGKLPMAADSGEHVAVYGPLGEPKPNLDQVLEAMNRKGRWHRATIAVAQNLPDDLSVDVWPRTLDRIEKTIEPIKPLFER